MTAISEKKRQKASGRHMARLKYSLGILACVGFASLPAFGLELQTLELPDTAFRPLPALSTDLRLTGEADYREWPVYLTASQAEQKLVFEAALTSAVSVMPEGSLMRVTVNGHVIDERSIEAIGKQQLIAFDVTPGAFQPGYNVVRMQMLQRHRVSCETAATYELWTEIDPSRTGLRFEKPSLDLLSFKDIAALAPDHRGAIRLRAVLGPNPSDAQLTRAVRVLSAVAVTSGFTYPYVEVVGSGGAGDGLDLFMGDVDQLTALGAPLIPELNTLAITENGSGVSLVIHSDDDDTVDTLVAQILENGQDFSADEANKTLGALSRALNKTVEPGSELSLSELGAETIEFNGRLLRTHFNLRMPEDFYPVETDSVELNLAGGYSSELQDNSQIVVRVNGLIAAGIPLSQKDGEVFQQKTLRLSLAKFRPGVNTVEISTQLIKAQDEDCDTLAALSAPPRFLLLDDTKVSIPELPRILALPSLNAGLTGGPVGERDQLQRIFIPYSDPGMMSAAATIAVRLGLDSEGQVPAQIIYGRPDQESGGAIILGSHSNLPQSALKSVGLSPERIQTAWTQPAPYYETAEYVNIHSSVQRRVVSLQSISDQEPLMTASIGSGPEAPQVQKPIVLSSLPRANDAEIMKRWEENVDGKWNIKNSLAGIGEILTGTEELDDEVTKDVGSTTSLVIAQGEAAGSKDGFWTVFASPSSTILALSIQDIVSPHRWRQVRGKEARYDMIADTIEVTSIAPTRYFITQPYSLKNWRLVTAGWLSRNPFIYAGLLLVVAVFVAFTTRMMLSLNRRGQ
ncbi:cellulose biosynthesis cyclic di-GMP-binding regulatory protein BcsB [Roseibium sediminis]|uniref:cellulose biosynthesis cyclic di-GMP-binding regulatory protein BcsB n=1 Tax=Roseibium sediminis TaxID=1775174 RepID=UPI00123D5303|nr:cellulose biosynthesis cyclic di-GMP-binding regulatory protein BcsB [Roseibium sediminis]